MDLDPMINNSDDENDYSNYDNRPIRPMDQEALNQALARLPILVDENDSIEQSNHNTSIKARRQPVLAYSTRRKNLSGVNINQSLLNTSIATPINNKRKLGGSTPTNKFIKQIDSMQMQQEHRLLEEAKANLQLECLLLKKAHDAEIESLKQEHQQEMDRLLQEHKLEYEKLNTCLTDKEQLLIQTNLELDNLRNDQTMLLLEKETLDKIIDEYKLIKDEMSQKLNENEIIIKNLREQIENLTKNQQKKPSTLLKNRVPLKETSLDQKRTVNNPVSNNKSNTKVPAKRGPLPTSSIKPGLIKSNVLTDNRSKLTSARIKPPK